MRKQLLQAHRVRAMLTTIELINHRMSERVKFCEDFAKVYRIKDTVVRAHIRDLKKYRKAAMIIKEITCHYCNVPTNQTKADSGRIIKIAPVRSAPETAA